MRITFVAPEFNWSGGIRVLAVYAKGLHALGHDVRVVSVPYWAMPLRRRVKHFLMGRGWAAPQQPTLGHFTDTSVPCHVLSERRPVTDGDVPDADVVIATWWETAEWVADLLPRKGAKVYFVQGHERVLFEHDPELSARIEATYRPELNYVTVSRWLERVLRTQYGLRNVTLVANGVDVDHFHAEPRGKQPAPTVGFMYSPAPMKGSSRCFEAIAQARRTLPQLAVRAFGVEAPAEGTLPPGTEYIRKPDQALIPKIYAACDAWLLASRDEGFGLPLLESMACRTPFVAMETGAAPELAEQGGGIVVPQGDTRGLADALIGVLQLDEAKWRAMSDLARATAVEHRWEARIRQFERALQSAVDAGG